MKKKRSQARSSGPISDALREIVARRDLTAFSIARDAEVDASSVSRFLARERTLSLPTLDAIADALGLRLVEKGKGRGAAKPDLLPCEREKFLEPAEVEPAAEPTASTTVVAPPVPAPTASTANAAASPPPVATLPAAV